MFALYFLGILLEPAIGTARFVGIYVVSVLGGSFGALLLDPNKLTVGASGGIFGLMAAAFLIARNRGLDELASQIGFFVIINLVFTFSVPNISDRRPPRRPGRRRRLAALLINALERSRTQQRRDARGRPGLIALCAVAVGRRVAGRRVEPRLPGSAERAAQRAGRSSSATSSKPIPARSRDGIGVQEVGEQLDPVDEARAGARERRGGVDRDHPLGAERAQPLAAAAGLRGGLVDVEAARHRDDDLGLGGRDLLPVDDARLLPGDARARRRRRRARSSPAPSGRR